ncbi:hypothetical protein GOBAR_AA38336 [Gossypium barbadense]|uniref:Uncharacterized protein n=1 Tax=Gossypium barbadense TaxID=3634 RepID=A0A2P5VU74_GOSBA|nr:hypothetical protein GOBAR_AA38336 [Gossypium barbadense]
MKRRLNNYKRLSKNSLRGEDKSFQSEEKGVSESREDAPIIGVRIIVSPLVLLHYLMDNGRTLIFYIVASGTRMEVVLLTRTFARRYECGDVATVTVNPILFRYPGIYNVFLLAFNTFVNVKVLSTCFLTRRKSSAELVSRGFRTSQTKTPMSASPRSLQNFRNSETLSIRVLLHPVTTRGVPPRRGKAKYLRLLVRMDSIRCAGGQRSLSETRTLWTLYRYGLQIARLIRPALRLPQEVITETMTTQAFVAYRIRM